jgi:hypothetical protein
MKLFSLTPYLFVLFLIYNLSSCQQQEQETADDPVSSLNKLMREYGHIGHQNPLDNTAPGTMLAGKPSVLSFIANSEDCFPSDEITRHVDQSNFSKKHSYKFKGGFGFFANANNLFSAGLSLKNDYMVNIEITNMTIEYMSSIDITDWYQGGMRDTCKSYLDDVGFIIQAVKSDNLKISIKSDEGTNIQLDPTNISQYIQFDFGVNWELIDEYTVEITTPKYIGYQLGRLRLDDDGRSLYRATVAENDKFIFERIGLFDDSDNFVEDKNDSESNMDLDHLYYR